MRFLIYLLSATTAIDLLLRFAFLRNLKWQRIGIYGLTFAYEVLAATLLVIFLSAMCRRVRLAKVARVLLLGIVIGYSFLLFASWGFFLYYKTLPGVLAFSYLWEEPQDFFNIITSTARLWHGLIFAGFVALIYYLLRRVIDHPTRWKTSKMRVLGLGFFVGVLTLVLNHNLELGFGSSIPVTDSVFAFRSATWRHFFKQGEQVYLQNRLVTEPLPAAPGLAPMNVIVIINESLRKQNLSLYGYHRKTTPGLDKLVAEYGGGATVFENAFSNATQTYISVPSILSGINPIQGMAALERSPLMYEHAKRYSRMHTALITSHSYLVGNFKAYVTSPALDYLWYRETDDLPTFNNVGADDKYVPERFATFVRTIPASERFFAVLHLNGTHYPYKVPDSFKKPFAGSSQLDAYDNAVSYVDAMMGAAIAALSAEQRANTAIVITSDHGESFGEDGTYGHIGRFTRANTNIPLIILLPPPLRDKRAAVLQAARKNIAAVVSNIDLAPTVLDLLNLTGDTMPRLGASLLRPLPVGRVVYQFNLSHRTLDQQYFGMFAGNDYWLIARNMASGEIQAARNDVRRPDGEMENHWAQTSIEQRKTVLRLMEPYRDVVKRLIPEDVAEVKPLEALKAQPAQ